MNTARAHQHLAKTLTFYYSSSASVLFSYICFHYYYYPTSHQKMTSSSPSTFKTFYDVLEIPTNAEPAAIRTAFKKALLKFHPDKIPLLEKQHNNGIPFSQEQKDAMTAQFQSCLKAANCLLDAQSKARYDAFALGKQMIDIAGRVSDSCSLKEEFEKVNDDDDDNDTSSSMLYSRECRCGGEYTVIWNPEEEQQQQEKGKKKYSNCDSCSLVIEVVCDI